MAPRPKTAGSSSADSVGAVVAAMLAALGTEHFFLLTGGDNAFLHELAVRRIRMCLARSERSAAYMADAYSRLRGTPAFAYGQFGPGATVLLSGLIDATLAGTPVVAIASETRTETYRRFAYQEADQQAMYRPLVKWNARVERPDRVTDLLRTAIREAVVGPPGPTYLGIPSDLLLAACDAPSDDRYVEAATARIPPYRPPAAASDIDAIADVLRKAHRPVVLAGGGTIISEAFAALESLTTALGLPVVTTGAGKGSIAETQPLAMGVAGRYSRTCANALLRSADVVLAVGTRLNDMTTDRGRAIDSAAAVAQIDIDPRVIGLNRQAAAFATADAATALAQLTVALADDASTLAPGWSDWRAQARHLKDGWLAQRREIEERCSGVRPVSPVSVVAALRECLEPDDIVVADTGYMAAWTSALYDTRRSSRTHLRTAGSLGWGLPASLGAQLAVGNACRVVAVTGDGGIGYHFADIETAVRLGLPVVVVLMNNRTLAFEYQSQRKTLGLEHPELNNFSDADYAAAARAFGAHAESVKHPRELVPALRRALDSGLPALLDVRTDRDAPAPVTNFEHVEERLL